MKERGKWLYSGKQYFFKIFFSSPKHEADKLSIKYKVMTNIENFTKIVYLMILGAGVFELG